MSSAVSPDLLASFHESLTAFSMLALLALLITKQILSHSHASNLSGSATTHSLNRLFNVLIVPLTMIFLLNFIIRLFEVMR